MKGNGFKEWGKEKVSKFGLMVVNMRENGKIIKLMVMAHFFIQMEMSMKETGHKIKRMAMENIHIQMEQNTQGNGKTISNMGKAQSNG